jgi:histidine ammonia-lyase
MLNEGLPAFLAHHPGLESGLMMLQVTAASLVAECRVLASPASTGSITTSGNKEDYVSMGMTSALKLRQAVEHVRRVLAIEWITASHALEFLVPLKTSPELERLRALAAEVAPRQKCDVQWSKSIESLAAWMSGWRGLDGVWKRPA